MNYEVGDIIKDKYTNSHFMITKVIPTTDMVWYMVQSLKYGSIRDYNDTVLDTGFDIIQKGKQ